MKTQLPSKYTWKSSRELQVENPCPSVHDTIFSLETFLIG